MPGSPDGVELVFLQATPFCNIDCRYCYLPDRSTPARMSFDTLRRSLSFIRTLGAAERGWCVVWHIGEPMVVPVDWYRQAHRICSETLDDAPLELHFQTNGTLLTREWVELFQSDPRLKVGLSFDGPAWMHDAHRVRRNGRGTHAEAMRGAELLKANGISFDCIAVVTRDALDHPDDFFDFFLQLQPRMLSINPENVDGANRESTLAGGEGEAKYRRFLRRIADLHLLHGGFAIRNFLWAELNLRAWRDANAREAWERPPAGTRLTRPWRIVSVDWRGSVHTFSPSLLGLNLPGVGPHLGNVHTDAMKDIAESSRLVELRGQIDRGIARCERECAHFAHCGGGSPAHKWYERGSFDVSETKYCRLGVQADWEEYLAAVEEWATPVSG